MSDAAEDRIEGWYGPYRAAFGEVPPVPRDRITYAGRLAPEFTDLAERMRLHALHSDVMPDKWSQMMAVGILIARGSPMAAKWHARAARREGASFEELHKVVEIAAVVACGVSAINPGGLMLKELADEEDAAA